MAEGTGKNEMPYDIQFYTDGKQYEKVNQLNLYLVDNTEDYQTRLKQFKDTKYATMTYTAPDGKQYYALWNMELLPGETLNEVLSEGSQPTRGNDIAQEEPKPTESAPTTIPTEAPTQVSTEQQILHTPEATKTAEPPQPTPLPAEPNDTTTDDTKNNDSLLHTAQSTLAENNPVNSTVGKIATAGGIIGIGAAIARKIRKNDE